MSERLLTGAGRSLWYCFGPQGETRQLTDSAGLVADTDVYTAYGVAGPWTGSDPNPFLYGGQFGYMTWQLGGVSLQLCGARWYSPQLGRWLSRDPIGYAGGVNLYEYCLSDPVAFADRFGLQTAAEMGDGSGEDYYSKRNHPWYTGGSVYSSTALRGSAIRFEAEMAAHAQFEAGMGRLTKGTGDSEWVYAPGMTALEFGELAGGHAMQLHVGKTPTMLRSRFVWDKSCSGSSSFYDKATAEATINGILYQFRHRIAAWAEGSPPAGNRLPLNFKGDPNSYVGFGYLRGNPNRFEYNGVKVILQSLGGKRWHVLSAYPANIK